MGTVPSVAARWRPLFRPALAPGELVWARVTRRLAHPSDLGKVRPAVLVESDGSDWAVMALTSLPRHLDGRPRVAVPDSRAVGLRSSGWLWSPRLGRTSELEISDHLGWVDHGLARAVIDLASLEGDAARRLVYAADGHHLRPSADRRPRGRA